MDETGLEMNYGSKSWVVDGGRSRNPSGSLMDQKWIENESK